jgi:hypothetical protein
MKASGGKIVTHIMIPVRKKLNTAVVFATYQLTAKLVRTARNILRYTAAIRVLTSLALG